MRLWLYNVLITPIALVRSVILFPLVLLVRAGELADWAIDGLWWLPGWKRRGKKHRSA